VSPLFQLVRDGPGLGLREIDPSSIAGETWTAWLPMHLDSLSG